VITLEFKVTGAAFEFQYNVYCDLGSRPWLASFASPIDAVSYYLENEKSSHHTADSDHVEPEAESKVSKETMTSSPPSGGVAHKTLPGMA
jgi:hypothetical protein